MPKRPRSTAELQPELKFLDSNQPKATVANTVYNFVSALPNVGLGTGPSARVGNSIFVKSLQVKVHISGNASVATPNGVTLRFGVYHNKLCNGILPIAANVFADATKINSCRNTLYASKHRVLDDNHVFMTQHATSTPTTGPPQVLDIFVPINRTINYTGSTGTIADLLKDDIGIYYAVTTANAVNLDISSKLRFSDA